MIEKCALFTRESVFIGYLKQDDFKVCTETAIVNSSNSLSVELALHHPLADYFVKYNRIVFYDTESEEWKEFILQSPDVSNTRKWYLEASDYELLITDPFLSITGNTVLTGLTEILSKAVTNWHVGTTDVVSNFDMQRTKGTIKSNIYDWAVKVGGEVKKRIIINGNTITRYIDILSRIGEDRGKVVYEDRDIKSWQITAPVDDYYTAVYGYGQIANDVQLTFAGVEWSVADGDPIDKPLGQAYLDLGDDAKEAYGYYAGGEYRHRFTYHENTQITDAGELLQETYDWAISNIVDKTQYKMTAADLHAMGVVDAEKMLLGDTVGFVIFKALNLKLKARVMKKVTDHLNAGNNTFEFNFTTKYITDTISQAASTAAAAKSTADEAKATAARNYISSVIDRWNSEINTGSAYIYSSPEDGIMIYNAPPDVATEVLSLKAGAWRIADSKTAEDWDYKTLATGKGMIADYIYTGIIRGENMDFDIDAGRIYFGRRVDGVIDNPLIDFTVDGITILGDETNNTLTGTGQEITRADNGAMVAKFDKDGAHTPNLIVDNQIIMGNFRTFQADENTIINTFIRRS